ncbi:MAG: GntR family transcriptional regulator [Rubrivivax sp.]|jgi:DNA-binding GntR family transcriptional regulator
MSAPADFPRTPSPRRARAAATSAAAGAGQPGRRGEVALPLARRALYLEVAERLREMIYDRRLPPGSWIDELKLCEGLGISRTPLREALKVLAVEGLVTMQVRRGAFVAEVSHEDVRQVYQLLGLLESDAAAAVAREATADELAELRALHERLERQVRQRDAFFAANEAFHLRLLQLGRNRWREQLVQDLRKVMKLNRHHSLFKRGRLTESLAEHRALMAALDARDPARAAALMRSHFDNGLQAATAAAPAAG